MFLVHVSDVSKERQGEKQLKASQNESEAE